MNYYERLGLKPTATDEEIKTAYRRLARQYHPDVDPSPEADRHFKAVTEAYGVLSDSRKRLSYNHSLLAKHSTSTAPATPTGLSRRELWAAGERVVAYGLTAACFGWVIEGSFLWLAFGQWATEWPFIGVASLIGIMRGVDDNFVVGDFFSGGGLTLVRVIRFAIWGGGLGYLALTFVPFPLMLVMKSDDQVSLWVTSLVGLSAAIGCLIAFLATRRDH